MDAKTKKYLIVGAVILALIIAIWYYGYRSGGKIPLPNNGGGIPLGWTAVIPVQRLISAMDGVGTDENEIFETLEGLTNDQLAAIINEYYNTTNDKLIDRFSEELSADDLTRALFYFKDVL